MDDDSGLELDWGDFERTADLVRRRMGARGVHLTYRTGQIIVKESYFTGYFI